MLSVLIIRDGVVMVNIEFVCEDSNGGYILILEFLFVFTHKFFIPFIDLLVLMGRLTWRFMGLCMDKRSIKNCMMVFICIRSRCKESSLWSYFSPHPYI